MRSRPFQTPGFSRQFLRPGGRRAVAGLIFLALSTRWQIAAAGELLASVAEASGTPIEGAVVFVYDLPGGAFDTPSAPYVMDQINEEFVPHLLPIVVGGRVRFPNKDDIHHHLYSFSPAKTFEFPLYKGEPAEAVTFPNPGIVKLGCNIHDWMYGIVLVLPTPYFAQTDDHGRATLRLPDGKDVVVAVFHELMKGSVDDTRRKALAADRLAISWNLSLRPRRMMKRSGIGYK